MMIFVYRNAFRGHCLNLPNREVTRLESCVWHAPKGFSKPTLCAVYGPELRRLFRDTLEVPNATSTEALEFLAQLRRKKSTTIADVAQVYVFLQEHCADT
jgi:hypothetical protein